MTNQERYVAAFREMERKYRDPYGLIFFRADHCNLCRLSGRLKPGYRCSGCPLSLGRIITGCSTFTSYKVAEEALLQLQEAIEVTYPHKCGRFPSKNEIRMQYRLELKEALTAFEDRADFHKKVANLFETLPFERFTKKGWIGFPEILEIETI